jgi:hypothetical protein
MFFGRQAEFQLVRKRFRKQTGEGGLLVFCGERRSGKTSILFQILHGKLGHEFIPVLIDMQSMAIDNETDFMRRIAGEILRQLEDLEEDLEIRDLAHYLERHSTGSAALQSFVEDALKLVPDKRLVLLFDEYELLEDKIDGGILSTDVLHMLSNLMEHHSVFFILTGSLTLEDRRNDYWKIFLGKAIYKKISFLERDDSVRLITEPVEGRVRYDPEVVQSIFRLAAGQPFYTQALCQSLVDHLNENRTNHATERILEGVVQDLVRNPLPQMVFRWGELEPDKKLVLALLAEAIPNAHTHVSAQDLSYTVASRQYPIKLDESNLAATLESLFNTEILVKSLARRSEYEFRMDLWRRWIRNAHAVWQVMQDLGMKVKVRRKLNLSRILVPAALVAVLAATGTYLIDKEPWRLITQALQKPPAPVSAVAFISVQTQPEEAVILRNGKFMGFGAYRAMVSPEGHEFYMAYPGYRDTTIRLRLSAEDSSYLAVELQRLQGTVAIETRPAGAEIMIDGKEYGRSPLEVTGLELSGQHYVQASLSGYVAVGSYFTLKPGSTTVIPPLVLPQHTGSLTISTKPTGAQVHMDGYPVGISPLRIKDLGLSQHTFRAKLPGYSWSDTTLEISSATRRVHIDLRAN